MPPNRSLSIASHREQISDKIQMEKSSIFHFTRMKLVVHSFSDKQDKFFCKQEAKALIILLML